MKEPSYIKKILDKERILEKIRNFIPKDLDQSDDNIFSIYFANQIIGRDAYPDNYLYIGKTLFCSTLEIAYYFLNFDININDNSVYFLNCVAVSLNNESKENFSKNKNLDIKESFLLYRGELFPCTMSKLFFNGTYEKFLSYF